MSNKEPSIAYEQADQLRDLVFKRVGVTKPSELRCPREKSFMTPCVARDGHSAVAERFGVPAICVGCGRDVENLLKEEVSKLK